MNDRDDRTNAHPHGGPAPPALQIMEAALGYNHHGIAVLPLHTVVEGVCSCGDEDCSSPGKRPYTHRGLHDASTDPDQIRRWWREWPDANVGIRTGAESELIVLDVDPDHGGDESLAQLEALHGPLPATVQQRTGGGGRHYLFQHPGTPVRNRAGFRPGLDVRGDGGYIVAPPSRHISGERYEWSEGHSPGEIPLAPAPAWLLELITSTGCPASGDPDGTATERIRVGQRHDRLFRLACHMRNAGADRKAILANLRASNEEWCEEPLPDAEVETLASDVSRRYPAGDSAEHDSDRSVELVNLALEGLGEKPTPAEMREVAGTIARALLPQLEREQMTHRLYEAMKSQGIKKSTVEAEIQGRQPKDRSCEESKESPPPPPEVIEAAERLLGSPNILEKMVRAVTAIGQVGEFENQQLVFLAAVAGHTARTHEDSIHLVVKGESSSGKNALLRNVLKLLPEDRVKFLTGVSQQALVYREGDIEGVLVFQEAEGEEAGDYQIRQAMSEGHLERWTVVDGESKSVRSYMRGSVFTTTTAVALHAENQTRVFDVVTDDSSETTRDLIERVTAKAAGGGPSDEECERQVFEWQVALERLESLEVVIPFAGVIGGRFPDQPVRARRDIRRCLGLIQACAILHQRTRRRDKGGRLLASPHDYEMVYPLIQRVLGPSMSAITDKGFQVAEIQEELAVKVPDMAGQDGWIDRIAIEKQAGRVGGPCPRTIRNWCEHFEETGAWEGRLYSGKRQYKAIRNIVTLPLDLPTPSELRDYLEKETATDSDVPTESHE